MRARTRAYEHELFDAGASDTLSYSLIGAPAGMTIDDETGLITWTPAEADGGEEFTFIVRVSDSGPSGASYSDREVTLNVEEVNDAPVYLGDLTFTIDEDVITTFNWADLFSDPEDELAGLTFEIVDNSDDAILDPTSTSSQFGVQSLADKFGYSFVTLRATDSEDLSTDIEVLVIAEPVDDAPRTVGAATRNVTISQEQWSKPLFVNLNELFFDPEWGTYLDYSYTIDKPELFGNEFGQAFEFENGILALYPSGVAGTAEITLQAQDGQTGLPAAERTLNVTIDALPYVWFEPATDGFLGGPNATVTLRRSGGQMDQSLDVQLHEIGSPASTVTFAAGQDILQYEVPIYADQYPEPPTSPNYVNGDNGRTNLFYTTGAYFRRYDDEAGLNRVWLESVSDTDIADGEYVDLTYKRSGDLDEAGAFRVLSHPLTGGSLFPTFSYTDGTPLAQHIVAWFGEGEDTVTVRATPWDNDGSNLNYFSDVRIFISQWSSMVIQSDSQTTLRIRDDDTLPFDLYLGLSEELEEDPGLLLGVNDNYAEGNTTSDTEDVEWDGVLHEIARERAARDNEPDRGRGHDMLINPLNQVQDNDVVMGVVMGGYGINPEGIMGTLDWTIPEGVKVYWQEFGIDVASLASRASKSPNMQQFGESHGGNSRVRLYCLLGARSGKRRAGSGCEPGRA